MSDKKRKLLKQSSLLDFMCGTNQSKSKRRKTDMNDSEKKKVRKAAESRITGTVENSSKIKEKMSDNEKYDNGASSSSPDKVYDTSCYTIDDEDDFIPNSKPSKENKNFKGVPIADLVSAPQCYNNSLKPIKPDETHTVLFDSSFKYGDVNNLPAPYPKQYQESWNSNHVHMPCSKHNEYPVQNEKGTTELRKRWELIEETYKDRIIAGPFELEDAILSYNQRYQKKWNFQTLRKYFTEHVSKKEKDNFFEYSLPKIIKLALQLPHLCTKPIPLLKKHKNQSITMSQQQIACLLANAFLCTFPRRNSQHKGSEYADYPGINFIGVFQTGSFDRKFQKLKCIFHYFERVTSKMPRGIVTFTRQFIQNTPNWENCHEKLPEQIHVSSSGTIEDDGFGLLQVDFANKYIGGGVLGSGCVQEEIRFLICPEMLISRLFTEALDNKECLVMKGCERFSNYDGYADSFTWAGNHDDVTPRDSNGRLCTDVVAIDALIIRNPNDQFKDYMLKRELNKAYVGFEIFCGQHIPPSQRPAVCTGNWGCGAFRGDKQLKALIQLMAAGMAKRDVCYFTFGDVKLTEAIYDIHNFLKVEQNMEIGVLINVIDQYYRNVLLSWSRKKKVGLFQYIMESFEGINHSESEDEEADFESEHMFKDEVVEHDIHDSSRENSIDAADIMECDSPNKEIDTEENGDLEKYKTPSTSTDKREHDSEEDKNHEKTTKSDEG
ncbi:poly(ADP-ribose) glycohydrolase isoform X1 [Patella vulgata]|uniref:poly(ADP-ribose) glycohydrolase isoform X1 n=2 Tax=Patella vulgata TaxID=6465 RepID=UPI00218001A3|nr:poly(ADP-ribose) glycohydrolase isoform X1 [Patella vulgata]XP_050391961.1 poly(ADP-ribose) glycohydrolase isoform X1 [Patella vulgata]XP_050391963.1 poly(ADP-ribose) glycohydrolase isoform X1 [Patella vulgata]